MALFLGKRPPVHRPTLRAVDFFRVEALPAHPQASPAPPLSWPMDRNDRAGVCVVASLDHSLQTIAHHLGLRRANWSDAEILALYQTQNPGFQDWSYGGSDADGGMVIQTFLEELVRRGEILAFGQVDHDNPELLRAASYVGLSVVTGSVLQEAQATQPVWDHVPGSPTWGGHAMNTVGYETDRQYTVTWGECLPMTDAFVSQQMDEAWMIVTQAMVNHPHFRNAFDLDGFAYAIRDLTDGKVIIPVPPPVPNNPITPITPTPPAPVPLPAALDDFPFRPMNAWADRHAKSDTKYEREAKAAYKKWKADHNLAARGRSRFRVVDADGRVVGEVDDLGQGFFASQS